MHQPRRFVIAGGGRLGARAAALLDDDGHDPLVIEQDVDSSIRSVGRRRGVVVAGDARGPGVLDHAGRVAGLLLGGR